MIYLTLAQAQKIVDEFGGDEDAVALLKTGGGHSGQGIYMGWKDYAEEGSTYIGAEDRAA